MSVSLPVLLSPFLVLSTMRIMSRLKNVSVQPPPSFLHPHQTGGSGISCLPPTYPQEERLRLRVLDCLFLLFLFQLSSRVDGLDLFLLRVFSWRTGTGWKTADKPPGVLHTIVKTQQLSVPALPKLLSQIKNSLPFAFTNALCDSFSPLFTFATTMELPNPKEFLPTTIEL